MKTKLFQVRLSKDHHEKDQEALSQFLDSVTVKKTATQLAGESAAGFWSVLVFYEQHSTEPATKRSPDKVTYPVDTELSSKELTTMAALKQWRLEKASELGVPPFMICSNAELVSVVKVKPKLFDDLQRIKGFGPMKVNKYGDEILMTLHSS